jgi:hypothetical protein
MAIYALTIFIGSFLLFQVEPIIAKYILPWFGGGPAVWTTCMLFFQMVLLSGYFYAHFTTLAGRARQGYIHIAMLLCAVPFLPISPSPKIWKPGPEDAPIGKILLLLLANIGMPYLVLSATAPLLQHWFVREFPNKSPYRLYALSNFASLLALLSYPFIVEPHLTLDRQVYLWSWGFAAYMCCCIWCALSPAISARFPTNKWISNGPVLPESAWKASQPEKKRIPLSTQLAWLLLSACGSAILLATTNQLCQEVAVIPFLWVLPLALYLLTFIVCFNSDKIYNRLFWGILLAASVGFTCRVLYLGLNVNLSVQILAYLAVLVACCMACHGELVRSRPDPGQLTVYYLLISAGGAFGGVFVALIAPLMFKGFWEFQIAMTCTCLVVFWVWLRDHVFTEVPKLIPLILVIGLALLLDFTFNSIKDAYNPSILASSRNFYGVLRVLRDNDGENEYLALMHGQVNHGIQYVTPGWRQNLATTYYDAESGAGLALRFHPKRDVSEAGSSGLRVGVIGLGIGTLASYGRKGDTFRFYEINPDVIKLAGNYFTFLNRSAADVQIVPGDARITLEQELTNGYPQQFDVLFVDAFTSDAIPVHLLTKECFDLYKQHLAPDGILLVNISNRFLNLLPIVRLNGDGIGLQTRLIASPGHIDFGSIPSEWVILTSNSSFLNHPEVIKSFSSMPDNAAINRPWTDNFASLWQVVK